MTMLEKMFRHSWKPSTAQVRDALVDKILSLALKPTTSPTTMLKAARVFALLNGQSVDVMKAAIAAAQQERATLAAAEAASQPRELNITLSIAERKAHIKASLDEGIRLGLIDPPQEGDEVL